MRNAIFLLLIFGIAFSCGKKEEALPYPDEYIETKYDTTAIDSFSDGAISVDIAERIRMSSQKYRDSVRQVLLLQEEERKKKEEQEKLEKLAKESLEKEQKDKEKENGKKSEKDSL